jgi:hypothetical protein
VTWHRRNGQDYVGAVSLGDGYVRLVGRDPDSNIEVSLSIPFAEIEAVHARGRTSGGGDVVLELAGSQAICLRAIGDDSELSRTLGERILSAVQA